MHFWAYSHFHENPFLRNCWLFVDFFFVLSGFVIAINYQQKLSEEFSLYKFILLRFGRIYPLHFVILLISIVYEASKLLIPINDFSMSNPFINTKYFIISIIEQLLLINGIIFDFGGKWNAPN